MLRMELEEKLMMLKVRVRGESKRERGVACARAAARARWWPLSSPFSPPLICPHALTLSPLLSRPTQKRRTRRSA
jgi:hypothetical protein